MDVERRLAELELRVSELERTSGTAGPGRGPGPAESPAELDPAGDQQVFWALSGLRGRAPGAGGVLFAGTVQLPAGERYEWQQEAPTDGLLDMDWSEAAGSIAALGHPVRLALLKEVLCGTRSTAELAVLPGLGSTGQLYHHIRPLIATGWLRQDGRGRYSVPPPRVVPLLIVVAASAPR